MTSPFSLKNILTLIPLFTACLYVMGWNYFQSYIGAFGLTGSQFPISTNDNLINGIFAVILMGLESMSTLNIAIWASIPLFFVLMLFYMSNIWDSVISFFTLEESQKIEVKRLPPEIWLERYVGIMKLVLAYIFFMAFLIGIIIVPSHFGKEEALKKRNAFPNTKLAYLDLGDQVYQAMPIQCSQTHCAYWLGEKAVILKHSDVKQHFAYPKK